MIDELADSEPEYLVKQNKDLRRLLVECRKELYEVNTLKIQSNSKPAGLSLLTSQPFQEKNQIVLVLSTSLKKWSKTTK